MPNNCIILFFLLIGSISIWVSGCSSSDDAGPCYYTYMEFGDQLGLKRISVQCTGPVALDSIYGQDRATVAAALGSPDTPKKEIGKSEWYRGGGIIIMYVGEGETATAIGIQPDNLEFTPESILKFLSISVNEEPTVSNRDIHWLDTEYGKIMANNYNDNPHIVESIDILP